MEGENKENKVWVTISRTINLGNYESIKIDAGLSQTVTNKNKISSTLDACCDTVWEMLTEKSAEYYKQLQPKPKKKRFVKDTYDIDESEKEHFDNEE